MFIGKYELNGELHCGIYFYSNYGEEGYKLWFEETFSPDIKNVETLDFKINGKTYKEKQASLEEIAKEWQNNFAWLGWSYGEFAEIGSWFYENAKRYGLIKVFEENAII